MSKTSLPFVAAVLGDARPAKAQGVSIRFRRDAGATSPHENSQPDIHSEPAEYAAAAQTTPHPASAQQTVSARAPETEHSIPLNHPVRLDSPVSRELPEQEPHLFPVQDVIETIEPFAADPDGKMPTQGDHETAYGAMVFEQLAALYEGRSAAAKPLVDTRDGTVESDDPAPIEDRAVTPAMPPEEPDFENSQVPGDRVSPANEQIAETGAAPEAEQESGRRPASEPESEIKRTSGPARQRGYQFTTEETDAATEPHASRIPREPAPAHPYRPEEISAQSSSEPAYARPSQQPERTAYSAQDLQQAEQSQRLDPLSAPRPRSTASHSPETGVRIGTLDIRIEAPQPAPAPKAAGTSVRSESVASRRYIRRI